MQTERVTFLTIPADKAAVDAFARVNGMSVGHVVREATSRYFAGLKREGQRRVRRAVDGGEPSRSQDVGVDRSYDRHTGRQPRRGGRRPAQAGRSPMSSIGDAFSGLRQINLIQSRLDQLDGRVSRMAADLAGMIGALAPKRDRNSRLEGVFEGAAMVNTRRPREI